MSGNRIKILVVSNTPWRMDNSFGNTFNAFFSGMDDIEIANVYCRAGKPDASAPISRAFQITEKGLLDNLKNRLVPSGTEVLERDDSAPVESAAFNAARKMRCQILFWGRDLIWKIGHWKSRELENFVDSFNPDLLFLPVYYSNYLCDIDNWAIQHCGAPAFANISDDIYTLRQSRRSPLYWIDRLHKRKKIKRVVDSCDVLYVISEVQQADYRPCFDAKVKILRKGFDFRYSKVPSRTESNDPKRLLYTGNVGSGRWRSLADIADIVSNLNKETVRAVLDIYTPTPFTKEMTRAFANKKGVAVHEPVTSAKVVELQENADVLIHVESLKLADKCAVRHSISTKIPDYLRRGKCILAYGPEDVASVEYLKRSNSALVAFSKDDLSEILRKIVKDEIDMEALGKRGYAFARANHNKDIIQAMLHSDFEMALRKTESGCVV